MTHQERAQFIEEQFLAAAPVMAIETTGRVMIDSEVPPAILPRTGARVLREINAIAPSAGRSSRRRFLLR